MAKALHLNKLLVVAYGKPNEPKVILSEKAKANVNRAVKAVEICSNVARLFTALRQVLVRSR